MSFENLESVIQDNLQYITGKPLVKNQETQIIDTEMIQKVKDLEHEIWLLRQEIQQRDKK